MKVFTAQQMRDFDRAATEQYGIPSIVLMENAALRVVEFLEWKFAPLRDKRILVFCGKGNNGGDGFAIARHLEGAVRSVTVQLLCAPDDLKGDALANYTILKAGGAASSRVQVTDANSNAAGEYDVIVDAVLGTGFKGAVRDVRTVAALHDIETVGAPVVAVDIPSAVEADTGAASEAAVRADYTVTFGAPKRGFFLQQGLELVGEVWVGSIGTPPAQMADTDTGCDCITREKACSLVPHRPLDSHKGIAGRVVLCGGSYGMSGAPTLAARASLMAGAGLCIACLPDKILPLFATAFSEATSHPLPCDGAGSLLENAADAMGKHWDGANVVALGPGLSRTEGALNFARRIVRECPHPLVIDADALYALRSIEADVKERQASTILTPHPGEMGELMQMKVTEVQADRLAVAQRCAEKFNALVVLKGSRSVVALPTGRTFINLTGNAGMATGGAGDVLTGTISGLLAQTKNAASATLLGVYLHGLAGDMAYATLGNGLIAGDIARHLPLALQALQHPPEAARNARLVRLA